MNYNKTISVILVLIAIPLSANADIAGVLRRLSYSDWDYEGERYPWVVALPESLSETDSGEITRLAESGLDQWKRMVTRSPKGYRVDTLRYSYRNASLGVPYYIYEVDKRHLNIYMQSGKNDPRPFAVRYQIYFPILIYDKCLGVVVVSPNVKMNGRRTFKDDRKYHQSGWVISGPNFQNMYRNICKVQNETGLKQVSVSILLFGGWPGNWYMQPRPDGRYFVFESSKEGLWWRRPRVDSEKRYLH